MKKHFFFFLFLISSFLAAAQTYNYIGVEDGLSNRRVYAIQKGPKGYMWFLTHDGIDRYNGKEFKHYKLMDGEDEINSMMNLNWLYSDSQGRLWEIGKQGRVFCYESKHDRFQLVYKLPKSETEGLHTPVSYGFIDDNNINRFFNEGAKVFKRPGMAIDREVFSCHPPKIEPMVRSIIESFKNHTRDSVPVWMEKQGKPFLVTYYAVRDKKGIYLGTVEVVQDMQFAKEHFTSI